MKNYFLTYGVVAAIAALGVSIGSAQAQVLSPSSTSSSTSNSGANSNSGSTSTSTSTSGNTRSGSNVNFNTGNNSPVSTNIPNDTTVRAAPTVYAPGVVTGNVCALGASAGGSFIGTGITLGGTWESEQCERRQTAALLHNAGYATAARELMCDKREVYDSMKRGGTPCQFRPNFEAPGAQPPSQMPVVLAPPVVTPAPAVTTMGPAPAVYPRCSRTVTDNCQS